MSPTETVVVHFDGACFAGRAAWGFTVDGGGVDHEGKGQIRLETPTDTGQTGTNNLAEYTAAIRALEYLRSRGYRGPVEVLGDSQLVVRQVNGEYAVKAPHLVGLHERVRALARDFERITFTWVPRESNRRADTLSKEALAGER